MVDLGIWNFLFGISPMWLRSKKLLWGVVIAAAVCAVAHAHMIGQLLTGFCVCVSRELATFSAIRAAISALHARVFFQYVPMRLHKK